MATIVSRRYLRNEKLSQFEVQPTTLRFPYRRWSLTAAAKLFVTPRMSPIQGKRTCIRLTHGGFVTAERCAVVM